jgi:uncharacterized protein YbjT (DUF2867 family)
MPGTILAIGASGKFAGLVIPALAKRGAFIRKPEQASMVRKNGAAEIAIGDLQDQRSVDAALVGIEAIFYVAPAFLPNEAEVGKAVVTSAQKAGVSRFVFSSVIHPVLSLPNHAAKAPVEEAVINSGMFDHYNHHGLPGNSLTLRAILGREPRNLRTYFEELAARGL